MSDIVYLKIIGEQQGDISSGCGSANSVGNRHQINHEDEIFSFELSNTLCGVGAGMNFNTLNFRKLIDKSSPLLARGITNNEKFFLGFNIYRLNQHGRWERYFYIELRGATLASVNVYFTNNHLDTEIISVRYEYILCRHLIANTEFSYLAFPENYNNLFSIKKPIVAAHTTNTINSKTAGRLLAAGGIYNGNIEGFRQTAEQLGADATKGYDQVLNETTSGSMVAAASIFAIRNPMAAEKLTSYLGKYKKAHVLLDDVNISKINYLRRDRDEYNLLRSHFNNSVRPKFLKSLSDHPDALSTFDSDNLLRLSNGNTPSGWQVHHKVPLDDGGTNNLDNLILIQNSPYHSALSKAQATITKDLPYNASKEVLWPSPKGVIYPVLK